MRAEVTQRAVERATDRSYRLLVDVLCVNSERFSPRRNCIRWPRWQLPFCL